jgi:hypothetical protein
VRRGLSQLTATLLIRVRIGVVRTVLGVLNVTLIKP